MNEITPSDDPIIREEIFHFYSNSKKDDETIILSEIVRSSSSAPIPCDRELRLMMIGCEDSDIYGPNISIANMFLSLFQKVFHKAFVTDNKKNRHEQYVKLSIAIYDAKQEQYPISEERWDMYHGIIISGSLSAAYEYDKTPSQENNWIQTLLHVIQTDIHPRQRKVLGVCFGHQIYAHSFQNQYQCGKNDTESHFYGQAVPCPHGIQVGPRTFDVATDIDNAKASIRSTSSSNITMLYTHGDMVQSIPDCAISLGGTKHVTIQACAYFSSRTEKRQALTAGNIDKNHKKETISGEQENNESTTSSSSSSSALSYFSSTKVRPYAITFQGHPEYAATGIGIQTFLEILDFMDKKQKLPSHVSDSARKDAIDNFSIIERDSVNVIYDTALIFGWL
mmetsp:Transcript_28221/g.34863  ORF Transcript_28221/g.34863 Transcript_28221/m.34863 type:complete len:394 (+) Transcript_28221:57-1238(+)